MFIGWRIWKREQITLIHAHHYKRVAEKDKKAYTERMGKAVMLIGTGIILMAAVDSITGTVYGWTAFGVCFVWGMVIMLKAQKKYNGGLF